MTHLSESEFVDLAENDGALDSRRRAHVQTCPSCREQVEALRAILRAAAAADVPEPSPLFWDHLTARVRDAVAAEPAAVRPSWSWIGIRGLAPVAGAAVLVAAMISGVLLVRATREANPTTPAGSGTAGALIAPAPARPETAPDADNAEVWAVLTAAASDVALDDARAAGMHVLPAAIDHAVQDLTEAELTELGRLLQSELKRSSD